MFQNIEFYRSRGPRFFSSLGQRKHLPSELVSEASEEHSEGEKYMDKRKFSFYKFRFDCVWPEQMCFYLRK